MNLHDRLAASHPALERGMVQCQTCGASTKVNSAQCLRAGWPKCCGYTMRLLGADEQPKEQK